MSGEMRFHIIETYGIPGEILYLCIIAVLSVVYYLLPKVLRGKILGVSKEKGKRLVLIIYAVLACIGVVSSVLISTICVDSVPISDSTIRYVMYFEVNPLLVLVINIIYLIVGKYFFFTKSSLAERLEISKETQRGLLFICLFLGQLMKVVLLREFFFDVYHYLEIDAERRGLTSTIDYSRCVIYFYWELLLIPFVLAVVIYYILARVYGERRAKLSLMYLKSKTYDKIHKRS